MDILEQDFLDEKIYVLVKEIREKHKSLYDQIFKINELFLKDIYNSFDKSMNNIDDSEIYIQANIAEIHKSFQSTIILFERGLHNDAMIILRGIYEKTFVLKAIINNPENIKFLFGKTNNNAKTMHDNLENGRLPSYINLIYRIKEIYKKYKTKKIYEWAKKAGMEEEYCCQYAILSNYTHYDLKVAKEDLINTDGNITINTDFKFNNFDDLLGDLLNIFKKAIVFYCEHKKLNILVEKLK